MRESFLFEKGEEASLNEFCFEKRNRLKRRKIVLCVFCALSLFFDLDLLLLFSPLLRFVFDSG